MEKWEQMDKPLRDLIEIIRFTEDVSAKIPGLLDEAEIYRTMMEEFAQSKRYTASILLLTEDASSLRIVETSLPPEQAEEGEKAAGVQLKGYKIDLDKSSIYRQVVREGKTLRVNVSDVIGELFPRPLAYLISKALGYEKKPAILTPLKRRGEIIGTLAMSSTELAEHLIPSVRNLAQHISTALELADEYAERVRVEERLRENERKFRLVTETIQDVFWMSTPGVTDMIHVSPAYEGIWGRSAESLYESPRSFLEALHPEDLDRYLDVVEAFHAKGKAYECEYRIVSAAGPVRWIHSAATP